MGYWPAKLICFLNMIIMVGYCTISCIIAGQILSAVSGGSMSIAVGVIITALVSWLVAVFGMAIFQTYERYGYVFHTSIVGLLNANANGVQMGLDPTSNRPSCIGRYRL